MSRIFLFRQTDWCGCGIHGPLVMLTVALLSLLKGSEAEACSVC